jgi:hypothetical protein
MINIFDNWKLRRRVKYKIIKPKHELRKLKPERINDVSGCPTEADYTEKAPKDDHVGRC